MFIWFALLVFAGVVVQLNSRLRRLEAQVDWLQARDSYASWAGPTAPEVDEKEAGAHAYEPAQSPPPPIAYSETISEPIEAPIVEEEPVVRRRNVGIGFEELFGRRLPIWAGGITLAIAGVLIVKLSIESGLLKPIVRVISGLIFGAALICSAELALRFEGRIRDPRVRQALCGAGVASLYASILVAVDLYHLLQPLTAMLGMAGVTVLALFLSTRFGPASALLGLTGGLAAPAMIGSAEPNVPLLSVYLALAVSGLCALSHRERWAWLGISALIGGFGWGVVLLLGGILDKPSEISLGLYLLLLGAAIPALGFAGRRKNQIRLVAGVAAAAQMAALVATGGFALINWGLFALLSIASVWLAQRDKILTRLPAVGLLTALLLMGIWTSPKVGDFVPVIAGFALIYGTPAVWQLWRSGGFLEAAEISAIGLGALLVPMFHFYHSDGSTDIAFGLLAVGLSLAVGACAAVARTNRDRSKNRSFALLGVVTAVLLSGAALLILPIWAAGVGIALIGLMLLHVGQLSEDRRLASIAWIFGAAGVLACPYSQIVDGTNLPNTIDALHWAAQAAIAAAFAWRERTAGRDIAQFLTPAFLYLALSPLVSDQVEPLTAPVLLVGVAAITRFKDLRLAPAMASCFMIIIAWALSPLLTWSMAAAASLVGSPVLVSDVPGLADAIAKLLVPAALGGAAVLIAADRLHSHERIAGCALSALPGLIGAHSLYKQLFAISTPQAFVDLGLVERTLWELAFASLAFLAVRLRRPVPGLILAAAAAAHELLYTLLLHNPLWSAQAVGGWPVLNMLLPVYVLALGLAVAARRAVRPISEEGTRAADFIQMILIVLFAFSELRQLFHGALLTTPGLTGAEDILRSILAIALAVGFLIWGITRQHRDWRIASLVLMLAAVGKVFLFDASGLEGVTRIASFVALGLSLIGIGWLYARHLGADRAAEPA